MTRSQTTAFAGLIAMTLVGQLTLLAYEIALTRRFGTTLAADSLALAFMVAFALGNEIAGWIGAVVIPKYLESHEAAAGGGFLAASLMAVAAMSAIMAAGLMAFSTAISSGLAKHGAADDTLVCLFSPLVVLLPTAAVLASALQAKGRFGLVAMRPLFWYGAAFIGVVVWDGVGTSVVPIAMIVGLVSYTTILAIAAGHLIRQPGDGGWRQLCSVAPLLGPLGAMSIVNYGQILVERGLASQLGEGSLSAMTYAFRLVNAPITLFVVTGATMLLPSMSRERIREGEEATTSAILRVIGFSIILSAPVVGLLMSCSDLIVTLLFERGAFNGDSSRMTALAVFYYAPALVGLTALQLLVRGYWAIGRFGRLATIQVSVAIFGVCVMASLTVTMGFRGLAIAVSITSLVHAIGLLAGLRSSSGSSLRSLASLTARVCAVTILAVTAALIARRAPGNMVSELSFGLGVGLVVYVLLIKRVAPSEWASTLDFFGIRRRWQPS